MGMINFGPHRTPRGHTNCFAEETTVSEMSGKALIPIEGGASVLTVRAFPPLALGKSEWIEIGRRMGWIEGTRQRIVAGSKLPDRSAGQ